MPTAGEDCAAPTFKGGGLPSSFRLNSKSEITKARTPTTHTGRIYKNNFYAIPHQDIGSNGPQLLLFFIIRESLWLHGNDRAVLKFKIIVILGLLTIKARNCSLLCYLTYNLR